MYIILNLQPFTLKIFCLAQKMKNDEEYPRAWLNSQFNKFER